MKFPRNARVFRGTFDFTPYAAVFFLLVLFLLPGSPVYNPAYPGINLRLPRATDLPGTDKPSVTVAMDASGRLYYQNQPVEAAELKSRLKSASEAIAEPLTLVIQADKAVAYDDIIRLTLLGREAGIYDALLSTLPGPFESDESPPAPVPVQ